MDILHKLETQLVRFYNNFPNLPREGRSWLGRNAWWIILIIAILNAFGCFGLVAGLVGSVALNAHSSIYGAGYGGYTVVQSVISLVAGVIVTILYFSAIKPLRDMRRPGWLYVFYAQVVGLAFSVVNIVLSAIFLGSPLYVVSVLVGFAIGLLFTLVWLYFIFQIRDEFAGRSATAVVADIVDKKKRTTKK